MRTIAFRRIQKKRIKKLVRRQETAKIWDFNDTAWVDRAIMLRSATRTICSCPMCKFEKHNGIEKPRDLSFIELAKTEQE